jgi:hypothetical protein
MEPQMLGVHQSTYDGVFQHPVARNLQWREVRAMLTALADEVQEERNGNVKFTRNGQTLTIHPPRHKDFSDVEAIMHIRHFLERTGTPMPAAVASAGHVLVVIDHREARIFHTEMHGSIPQRITPFDPTEGHRHLHNVDNDSNGQRKPELKSFYDAIAHALAGAEKILILGSATGSSSAMEHLVATLKDRHPEIARRIVGTVVVNEKHISEDQMLAEARAFYATQSTGQQES